MATSGPLYPSTLTPDGSGTVAWSNLTNLSADDATYATAVFSPYDYTDVVDATAFGFAIPGGSTIDGIVVEVQGKVNTADDSGIYSILLLKAGTPTGDNKGSSDPFVFTASDTTKTWGGAADLWGTTWTVSDINNSGFGFQFYAQWDDSGSLGGTRTVSVDFVRITVHYTAAGGGGSFIARANVSPTQAVNRASTY